MPEKQVSKRQLGKVNNIKHGRRSKLLKQFGACELCPVRDICRIRPTLTSIQQKRGCDDIRNIFLENIRSWKKPGMLLVRNAAEIRTKIEMQELLDGVEKDVASPEWLKLMDLELRYAKEIIKLQEKKNTITNRMVIEHRFNPNKDDEIIEVFPEELEEEEKDGKSIKTDD